MCALQKTVLITGATGNLGRVVTDAFAQNGYQVVALVSPGKALPAPVVCYEADLAQERQTTDVIHKLLQQHPQLDAALLLAGGYAGGKLADTTQADVVKMIELNFFTAFHVARIVHGHMCTQAQGGRVVLVGARPALQAKQATGSVAYALSKTLVMKLAEIMNAEGASKNVITSVVVPSTIDTAANRAAMPQADFTKWVSAQHLAETMLYLCSASATALREPVFKMYGGA
ncbi:MAG: SDR family NAD(P)-dependent oxidoreductase [Bacteroidota bacterium]